MPSAGNYGTQRAEHHAKSAMPRTPGLLLGPFYPVHLAREHGTSARPLAADSARPGRRLELSGHVFDTAGQPVAGASIEMWHADPQGRYQHPNQLGVEEMDPGFVGYEVLTSQADGRWHVATVVPGPYTHQGVSRAPHLHFQVTDRNNRLVTQMFFPDDPLNATDRWYRAVAKPALLVATRQAGEPDHLALAWDIVLACG